MKITDVRVRKVAKEGKMKAVVSITLDDIFVVHDIKVIEGDKGLFIAMPSRKSGEGEYRDIAHPINSETREWVQKVILEVYEKALPFAAIQGVTFCVLTESRSFSNASHSLLRSAESKSVSVSPVALKATSRAVTGEKPRNDESKKSSAVRCEFCAA